MDGRVSLLHVGDVNVLGMTMTQATDYLKKLYATVYSNPMVTVALIQSNSRRYTVMGEIRTPGVFNLDFPVTVVQAIARSGGFTEWANHDITVVRAGDDVKTKRGEEGKTPSNSIMTIW
jgi:polysaccharide biosynthesis/export protein